MEFRIRRKIRKSVTRKAVLHISRGRVAEKKKPVLPGFFPLVFSF
jgi:hypothetical protein